MKRIILALFLFATPVHAWSGNISHEIDQGWTTALDLDMTTASSSDVLAEFWAQDSAAGTLSSRYISTYGSNWTLDANGLNIILKKQEVGGDHYTSARLQSKREYNVARFTFKYVLPLGFHAGYWPALWLINSTPNRWCEYDLEVPYKTSYRPNDLRFNIHVGMADETKSSTPIGVNTPHESGEEHTLVYEINENYGIIYHDGAEIMRVSRDVPAPEDASVKPCRESVHAVMNFAYGGAWPDSPVDDSALPANFTIKRYKVETRPTPTSSNARRDDRDVWLGRAGHA